MTDRYSEEEAILAVAQLTRTRLVSFVAAEIITPVQTDQGNVFRQLDLARMELLCELSEQFDLEDDALAVVIGLIDQLHGVRGELRAVLGAVALESEEVRARIAEALHLARSV